MNERFDWYPLAPGNVWTYRVGDGSTYTNEVVSCEQGSAVMKNSMVERPTRVELRSDGLWADSFQEGEMRLWVPAHPQVGQTWEIEFVAAGFPNKLIATVQAVEATLEVSGRTYTGVAMIETDSRMYVNNNWMDIQYRTQYHYAPGVGLVLTTSSRGDRHELASVTLSDA